MLQIEAGGFRCPDRLRTHSIWESVTLATLVSIVSSFFLNYSVSADSKTGIILPLFKGKVILENGLNE